MPAYYRKSKEAGVAELEWGKGRVVGGEVREDLGGTAG